MYLNSETQANVLARFNFALRDGGYLLLGKAEMLLAHSDLFTSAGPQAPGVPEGPRGDPARAPAGPDRARRAAGRPPARRARSGSARAAFEASPEAQIVVDAGGYLTLANARARAIFRLTGDDLGPAVPGPGALLPAAGAALQDPAGLRRAAPVPGRRGRVADALGRGRPPGGAGRPAARRPAGAARGQHQLHRRDPLAPATSRSWSTPTRGWRTPTTSSSRPTRSWRRPTRSSSRRSRSWRRPTRSSSRPTKSSRR